MFLQSSRIEYSWSFNVFWLHWYRICFSGSRLTSIKGNSHFWIDWSPDHVIYLVLQAGTCSSRPCFYIYWWYYSQMQMQSGFWFVAATRGGFWTWIWPRRLCGLGQEMTCWFQCWKNTTLFHLTGQISVVPLLWKWCNLRSSFIS